MKLKEMRSQIKKVTGKVTGLDRSFKITDHDYHVAVVGLGNAGKSVFLTSLIDHIRYPATDNSIAKELTYTKKGLTGRGANKGKEVKIYQFKPLNTTEGPFKPFPYEKYREQMAYKAEWPEKTGSLYSYRFAFNRSDWKRRITVNFIDFPGERLADATMVGEGYEKWSDLITGKISSNCNCDAELEIYTKKIEQEGLSASDAVKAYQQLLKSMFDRYRAWISPSVFRLDTDGMMPDCSKTDWWLERHTGVDIGHSFVPLTAAARRKNPELVKQFTDYYKLYRQNVVEPVFKAFKRCHSLILLVDICGILCEKAQLHNDALKIYELLIDICSPKHIGLQKAANLLLPDALRPRGINRIALAATKSDMVKAEQVGRLRELVKEMTADKVNNLRCKKVPVEIFTCSAVRCALPDPDTDQLAGHLKYNSEGEPNPVPHYGKELDCYEVDDLPKSWPHDWKPDEYCFPELYPRVPRRQNMPPEQEGLGRILDFILGSKEPEEA